MSKEKEQIAIFIDHYLFVRHFLKPDSFDVILKKYKVTLVVPSKSNKRLKSDLSFLSNKLDLIRLDVPDYRRLFGKVSSDKNYVFIIK